MLALEFHPLVEADLTEAAEWYERQQPGLGERFAIETHDAPGRLPKEASLYGVRFDDIRRMNLPSFPYGVFCIIERDVVVVLAVFHGARDFRSELERRRTTYG